MRLLDLAPVALFLGCGPKLEPPPPEKPLAFEARGVVKNDYAESLFSLNITLPDGGTINLFDNERIAGSAEATSRPVTFPAEGVELDFTLNATSLGTTHTFNGRKVKLGVGAERLVISYDFDLALAVFRARYGTRGN